MEINVGTTKTPSLTEEVVNEASKFARAATSNDVAALNWEKISEDDFMKMEQVVARPFSIGSHMDVFPKDKSRVCRWVNFKSKDGVMFATADGQGFTTCKLEDLDDKSAAKVKTFIRDGKIVIHDVVLMMIPKMIYFPWLAANHRKAESFKDSATVVARATAEAKRSMLNETPGAARAFEQNEVGKSNVSFTQG